MNIIWNKEGKQIKRKLAKIKGFANMRQINVPQVEEETQATDL